MLVSCLFECSIWFPQISNQYLMRTPEELNTPNSPLCFYLVLYILIFLFHLIAGKISLSAPVPVSMGAPSIP